MRDSVFSRYTRPKEPEEDTGNDGAVVEELKDYNDMKKKKNINLLIHVLEKMPVVEKASDETFLHILKILIEDLDPEKRVFDPKIKNNFEALHRTLE